RRAGAPARRAGGCSRAVGGRGEARPKLPFSPPLARPHDRSPAGSPPKGEPPRRACRRTRAEGSGGRIDGRTEGGCGALVRGALRAVRDLGLLPACRYASRLRPHAARVFLRSIPPCLEPAGAESPRATSSPHV